MAITYSYSRRSDVTAICREMDRLAGGHYFSEVRSCPCDSGGYWKYYVSMVRDSSELKILVSTLMDEAVMNLRAKGVLHA